MFQKFPINFSLFKSWSQERGFGHNWGFQDSDESRLFKSWFLGLVGSQWVKWFKFYKGICWEKSFKNQFDITLKSFVTKGTIYMYSSWEYLKKIRNPFYTSTFSNSCPMFGIWLYKTMFWLLLLMWAMRPIGFVFGFFVGFCFVGGGGVRMEDCVAYLLIWVFLIKG